MNAFEEQIGCPPSQFFSQYLNKFIGGKPKKNNPYRPYQGLMIGGLLLTRQWKNLGIPFIRGMAMHVGILTLGQITVSSRHLFPYRYKHLAYKQIRNVPTFLFMGCDLLTSTYRTFLRDCYIPSSDCSTGRLYRFVREGQNWVYLIASYFLLKRKGATPFREGIALYSGWAAATLFDPLFLLYPNKQKDEQAVDFLINKFKAPSYPNGVMDQLAQKIDFTFTETDQQKKWEQLNRATRNWLRRNHPDKKLNDREANKQVQEVNRLRSELTNCFQ